MKLRTLVLATTVPLAAALPVSAQITFGVLSSSGAINQNGSVSGANFTDNAPGFGTSNEIQLYFEGNANTPFRRDPAVVKDLEREKLFTRPAPSPNPERMKELRELARKLGLPE